MSLAHLKLVNGELVVPVPSEALIELSLTEGSLVNVTFAPGHTKIADRGLEVPQYNLDELLNEWEQMPEKMKNYREWVDAPRVGRELI